MANKKLTDLTELTTPADNDFLYIVDVSDTTESAQGTSKKIRKDKVDLGASKENIANKSDIYTTDTEKYYSATYVNGVLPTSYSKIVYVNATSPTTATIFDLENPPVTNDNLLKNDTANLYIGTDASTWVYLTGTGYVTKTISSAASNFYLAGTTTDAGGSKIAHITRSGLASFLGNVGFGTSSSLTSKITIKGSGSGNSTFNTVILNSSNSLILSIDDNGGLVSENFLKGRDVTATRSFSVSDNTGFIRNIGSPNTSYFVFKNGDYWLSDIKLKYNSDLSASYDARTLVDKGYTDAKITQAITNGVTDRSPSEDAVFDAIDGVVKSIISDTPTSTNTGGVSEVLMHTYTIAGGKLPSSCMPNLKVRISKLGTAGTVTIKVRVNTVNDFATATNIGFFTSATSLRGAVFVRNFVLQGGQLTHTNAANSLVNDEAIATNVNGVITYDRDVTQYWFFSLQNSDAGDTTRIHSIKLVN